MSALDLETVLCLSEKELDNAVYHHILHRIAHAWNDRQRLRQAVLSLTVGQQMVYTTRILEMEVSNGGFNQYFWNSSGQFAEEALAGYRLLGAERHATIVEAAIETQHKERTQQALYKALGTMEAFMASYETTELPSLDDAFYRARREIDLTALRDDYIRRNPEEFELNSLEDCYADWRRCPL